MAKKEIVKAAQNDLGSVLDRCQDKTAKQNDLQLLGKELDANPKALATLADLTTINITEMAKGFNNPAFSLIIEKRLPQMKKELGYDSAPAVEKLAIDGIVLTWLRWQQTEYKFSYNNRQGLSLNQALYWEKSATAAQGRYLKALATYAKIQKLARRDPALQVNIAVPGGQQVNIGGDIIKSDQENNPYRRS